MTPETIIQAVYEIGQAAGTERDATLGGADLGPYACRSIQSSGQSSEKARLRLTSRN